MGRNRKNEWHQRAATSGPVEDVCMCRKEKLEIVEHIVQSERHLVRSENIRFFFCCVFFFFSSSSSFFCVFPHSYSSFLVLLSFRSFSQIENRNRDVSVYQCWLLFIGFCVMSSARRCVNSLERIISSVIAYYCVYMRVCHCIFSHVDVVLCQSINSLFLLFPISSLSSSSSSSSTSKSEWKSITISTH